MQKIYKTQIMNKLKRIQYILDICKERGITAYEIGKNTKIASFTAHKILNGDTKNPSHVTLDAIIDFLESIDEKKDQLTEKRTNYENSSVEDTIADKVVQKMIPYFDKIELALANILLDNEEIKELIQKSQQNKTS